MSGLLSCKKLIPLKWMASQLAIEITLSEAADALLIPLQNFQPVGPQYSITDVNFIAELVEFDSTYDAAFYQGMVTMGVPLKFSSWHYHNFTLTGATSSLQIHERSRSVKMALAVARDNGAYSAERDSDRFFHDLAAEYKPDDPLNADKNRLDKETAGKGAISQYWWRIGGSYYPLQPVSASFGGAEAYAELSKCMDSLGDYTRASNIDYTEWSSQSRDAANIGVMGGGGSKFIMSGYFENTDVTPNGIAGINAEEQSDIQLQIKASANATINKRLDVFVNYDCMIVVRDNNSVELIL